MSLLKEVLDKQFHWTNLQYGWVNFSFQLSYGIGVLGFGSFIDRYGTKIGYATAIIVWSLAAGAHAVIAGVGGFIFVRFVMGLGEGGNFPAAIKATAQWFPRRERALATSLFNSGANFGACLAPAVVPLIAYRFGWQWAFVVGGVAGLIWLAVWLPLFDDPANSSRVSDSEMALIHSDPPDKNDNGRPVDWRELLAHRQAWSFAVAKLLTDPVWGFFLIWLPDFFLKTFGLDIRHSWTLLVGIYAIITVLSVFGGWLPGWLHGRGWSFTAARKASMLAFAFAVLPVAFVTRIPAWPAVALFGLAGAAHQAWSANLYCTLSDMFPKRAIGRLVAMGTAAGAVGGMILPLVTGWMLDHVHHAYTILLPVCSVAYLVAFGLNHLLAPRFEPLDAGASS